MPSIDRTDGSRRPRHHAEHPLLGVPIRFESDAAGVLAAVDARYATWRAVAARPGLVSGKPKPRPRIRLLVASGFEVARAPSEALAKAARLGVRTDHRRRLVLRHADASGFADLRRLQAVCRMAPAILEDADRFGELLDTLALSLVTRVDREPVHAAAVALNGRGLVLAGPTGAGKSTLAYAALGAGLRVLDDDTVYVQLEPRLRVWGKAGRIHLTPEAAAGFPELAARPPALRPNGKWKIPIDFSRAGEGEAPVVERVGLCFLERGRGPVGYGPMAEDEAVARLLGGLEAGFSAFRETIEPRLRAVAGGGVWRLRLSEDPRAAVSCIREILQRVGG